MAWLCAVVALVAWRAPATRAEEPPSSPVEAASPCPGIELELPSDEVLEGCGAVVGAIAIRVDDVFDTSLPEEDRWLFRLANRLHPRTREWVVRQQLLFREGEPYRGRLLVESERLLRANRYFYDAWVQPTRVHDGLVDVEVAVRDVWTLTAGAGASRSGGENSYRLEIEDTNFLGTGKDLTLEWQSTVDRDWTLLRYRDFNLAGSRARLEAWYATYSDGHLRDLVLERPFFALDERWSIAVRARREVSVDDLYWRGEVSDSFGHREELAEVSGGLSRGLREGRAWRWLGGLTYRRDRFTVAAEDPDATLPLDRELAYPWVGVERVEDAFVTAHDLDQIVRTEDLQFGTWLRLKLGWTTTLVGSEPNHAIIDATLRRGLDLGPDRLLFLEGHAAGRWASSGGEDAVVGGSARHYWRDLGRHLLFVGLQADAAHDLDRDRQLLLGGDNGLRGYPLRFQDGDRRLLLTVEQRFYTDRQILRLAHLGGAVFVDVGRSWFDEGPSEPGGGWLADIGLGLRLGLSRSGRGTMLHVDVAYPLKRSPDVPGVQLLISTKESF